MVDPGVRERIFREVCLDGGEKMGYKGLQVYDRSYKAALAIYKMVKAFPEEEKYALANQMQRASTSIALNIAEGYARKA